MKTNPSTSSTLKSSLLSSSRSSLVDSEIKRSSSTTSAFDNNNKRNVQQELIKRLENIFLKNPFIHPCNRYHLQLSKGCGDSTCTFKLCASCLEFKPISSDMIPIISVQLASRPRLLLCPRVQLISVKDLEIVRPTIHVNATTTTTTTSNASTSYSFHSNKNEPNQTNKNPHLFFLSSMLSTPSFSHLFDQDITHSDGYSSDGNVNESFECNDDEFEDENSSFEMPLSLFDLKLNSSLDNTQKIHKNNLLSIANKLNSQESLLLNGQKDKQGASFMAKRAMNEHYQFPKSTSTDSITSITSFASTEFTNTSCSPSSIQQMNKIYFYKMVKLYQEEPNNSCLLLDSITFIFSSRTCLGSSFVDLDSENSSNLDLDFLDEFYHTCLMTLDLQDALLNSIEILLSKLSFSAFNLHSKNTLSHSDNKTKTVQETCRIFLILLANPLLECRKHDEILMRKLCKLIGSLTSTSLLLLQEWLSQYSCKRLSRLICIFKDYLQAIFFPGPKQDSSVLNCLKVLQLFWKANWKAVQVVGISEFYSPCINQKLHFKSEFKSWNSGLPSYFDYPFLFDPISKTRIMRLDALYQMSEEFEQAYVSQSLVVQAQKFLQDSDSVLDLEKQLVKAANPFLVLEIKRSQFIQDAISQLQSKEKDLKKPIRVKFIQSGEEGMDQGGVQKEFFQWIVSHLMDPSYGLFTYDLESRLSWVSPVSSSSTIPSSTLSSSCTIPSSITSSTTPIETQIYYELFGVLLGLALYNGIMLGISFPILFYKKLLGHEMTFKDFVDAFPSLGNGLSSLLQWKDSDVEFVFCRNFEITIEEFGRIRNVELKPNGKDIPVTNENRQEFVDLYVKYTMEWVNEPFNFIRQGFLKVVQGKALNMCLAKELELMICGNTIQDYDFHLLENTTQYDDGYDKHHPLIVWFWEIVHDFSWELKKQLLLFVTASDRIPLNGYDSLTFVIQRNGPDSNRLPTSLTCFGRLLLPEYHSKSHLRNRLVTAIENASGFGLV